MAVMFFNYKALSLRIVQRVGISISIIFSQNVVATYEEAGTAARPQNTTDLEFIDIGADSIDN